MMAVAAAQPHSARSRSPQRNLPRKHGSRASERRAKRPVQVLAAQPRPAGTLRVQSAAPRDLRAVPATGDRRVRKNRRKRSLVKRTRSGETWWVATRSAVSNLTSRARGASGGRVRTLTRSMLIMTALGVAGLTASLGVIAGSGYIEQSDVFRASNVDFQPTPHVDLPTLRSLLAPAAGKPLWDVDLQARAQAIRDQPWVASARVVRMYPNTLRVDVQEHVPVAQTRREGQDWLVDGSGEIFAPVQTPSGQPSDYDDLPSILGLDDEQVTPPAQRERALQLALDTIERFSGNARPKLAAVRVSGAQEIAVDLRDYPTRLHFSRRGLGAELARFDALFAAAKARFSAKQGDEDDQEQPWSAVYFNGADRNRVVVRYTQHELTQSTQLAAN